MTLLAMAGEFTQVAPALADLLARGHTLVPAHVAAQPALVLAAISDEEGLQRAAALSAAHQVPWVALDCCAGNTLTAAAYRRGAVAVIPGDDARFPLGHAIDTTLALTGVTDSAESTPDAPAPPPQRHAAGDRIASRDGDVLELIDGVVATRALHADGDDVLLDLAAPGHLIFAHPSDACYIENIAHTDVLVARHPWQRASRTPALVEQLRDQLRWREAWAAAQARPHTGDRILSLLGLLGQRFGAAHPLGVLVDVHLTHAQLASATGRTRPTVTRVLRRLIRRGTVTVTGSGPGVRYLLPDTTAICGHTARQ